MKTKILFCLSCISFVGRRAREFFPLIRTCHNSLLELSYKPFIMAKWFAPTRLSRGEMKFMKTARKMFTTLNSLSWSPFLFLEKWSDYYDCGKIVPGMFPDPFGENITRKRKQSLWEILSKRRARGTAAEAIKGGIEGEIRWQCTNPSLLHILHKTLVTIFIARHKERNEGTRSC